MNKKIKTPIKTLALSILGLSTIYGTTEKANAIINIDSSTQYSNVLNNEKAVNIANAQAENEKRLARLYDVVAYLSSDATDAQKKQYVTDNLPENDVLKDGDQYALYNTKGSIVGSKVGAEPIVRVGAGSDVTTDNNGFLTIENVSGITIDGKNYTFAGGTTSGEVTFGNTKENEFRTLTNVAAGRLSNTSTDVVNGSQLHATNQALGATITKVNKNTSDIALGWNLKDSANVTTNVAAGDTVTVATTNNNLTANVTNDKLTVGLANNINVGTVTATTVTTGGVSISATGVNAGNTKVTNVANGTVSAASKDAVNGSQLFATNTNVTNNTTNIAKNTAEIAKGTVYSDGTNTTNLKLGETLKVVGDNKNIKTTVSDKQVQVALADDINVNSVTSGSVTVGTVVINNAGINAGNKKITNVANGTVSATSKDAVNGSQLFTTNTNVTNNTTNIAKNAAEIAKGWDLKDKAGATTNVGAGGAVTVETTNNNLTANVTAGKLTVGLANNLNVGSVTTGGVSISATGVNAGNTKVTNVANGTVSAASKDAVNGSQLFATNTNVTNNTTNIAKNTAEIAKGTVYSDGTNTTNLKLGETLKVVGDNKNIKTTVSDKQVQVALADDIDVNSVKTNSLNVGTVVINNAGINAGNKKITNVADGIVSATSKDAVNGSQLHAVDSKVSDNAAEIAKGWNLKDKEGKTTNIGAGGELTVETTNNNLTANVTAGKLTVGLANNLNVGSITTGGVSMSATGVNAGNTKVTNVANGTVSAASKDAVNGSQLFATNTNVTNNTTNIAKNTAEIAKGTVYSDGTNTTNLKLGETLKVVGDSKNIKTTVSDKQVQVALADDIDVNSVKTNSLNVGTVVINNAGINAGNKKITNVADGEVSETSKDAVNGSQLHAVDSKVSDNAAEIAKGWNLKDKEGKTTNIGAGGELTVETTNNNLTANVTAGKLTVGLANEIILNRVTTGSVSMSTSGINAGNKKITNVADGEVSEISKDAVNGSQLHAVDSKIADNTAAIAKGTVYSDGTNTTNLKLGETLKVVGDNKNIKTTVTDKQIQVSLSDDINVKTVVADKVSTGNVSMSAGGINAGNQKITNVANGEVSATSKDAVNGSQLHAVDSKITNNTNNIAKGMNYSDGTNTTNVQLGDTFKIVGDNKNIKTTISDKQVEVALADDIDVNSVKAKAVNVGTVVINDTGINAGSKKVTNVANGTIAKNSKDAVNGGQLFDVLNNIDVGNVVKYDGDKQDQVTLAGTNGTKITNLKDGDVSATSKDAINGSQLHATNQNVANNTTNIAKNTADIAKGTSYSDGKNTTNLKLGETLNIVGDSNIKTTVSDKQVQVGLSDHIKVKSITTGDVSISEGGVNAGNKTITNVAEGVKGTDAVNVNQLNRVASRVDEVDNDAKSGIAAAMAVGTLGQAWEPGASTVSVSGSTYSGKAGWAIGGSNMTDNGKWLLKYNVSGSSNNKYGAAASVTYQY